MEVLGYHKGIVPPDTPKVKTQYLSHSASGLAEPFLSLPLEGISRAYTGSVDGLVCVVV